MGTAFPAKAACRLPMAGCSATTDHRHPLSLLEKTMRSLLLFFLGIPIPIIILIALFVR